MTKMYDLRNKRVYSRPKAKLVGNRVVMRDISQITHIMVHQTAVGFSVPKFARNYAPSQREAALAARALGVACHSMAFRGGFFVRAADVRAYINHGNSANPWSVGLEIDANHPGLIGGKVWSGEETEATEELAQTSIAAIYDLAEQILEHGGNIHGLVTHRQFSMTRRADPGEWAYKHIVVPAAAGLGVSIGTLVDGGRPIPVEWDADIGTGEY